MTEGFGDFGEGKGAIDERTMRTLLDAAEASKLLRAGRCRAAVANALARAAVGEIGLPEPLARAGTTFTGRKGYCL